MVQELIAPDSKLWSGSAESTQSGVDQVHHSAPVRDTVKSAGEMQGKYRGDVGGCGEV